MNYRRNTITWLAALAAVGPLFSGGCAAATEDDEVAQIGAALELENGGLDMEDELPAFGLEAELDELQVLTVDPALEEPMAADAEVRAMREGPDAAVFQVALDWGRIPADPTAEAPHDWSGVFAINRGALLVDRTLFFEGPTDHVLPRRDRQAVAFTSATLIHQDGMILTIVDPAPLSEEPLVLTYIADLPGPLGAEAGSVHVPLRELIDRPRVLAADDTGNRMVAAASVRPVDVCEHGFGAGRWHRVAEGRGRIAGVIVKADGTLAGHVLGLYGVRESGEQVFFGKYIGPEGHFRGIFAGRYADGHFEGRWIVRTGDRGVLEGLYREDSPGDEIGGHFIGRWAELTCDMRPPPAPPPPSDGLR